MLDIYLPWSSAEGPAGKMNSDKNKINGAIKVLDYMISRVSINRIKGFTTEINNLFNGLSCRIKKLITNCSGVIIDW